MTQAQRTPAQMPPADWMAGSVEYPRDTPVHKLFEAQAATSPDTLALVTASGYVTYAELNARANHLARLLLSNHAQPAQPVALCLDRSPELIITLLAILKAGACYLPLDPAYPAERLQYMVHDSGASILVTTRSLATSIPSIPTTLFVDDLSPEANSPNPDLAVPATAPAYIMFTSGSTGRPKGVIIPHRAIVRLVRCQDYINLDSTETFLQFAPCSFDASTLEIWGPLLNGGHLAIAPPGHLSLDQIAAAIRSLGVTSLWLTSGLFNLIADEQLNAFAPLRQLIAGGDVLSIPHIRKVMAAHPQLRIINGYGPTESTTFACCHTVTPADLELPSIPIGIPIANTTLRILDESLSPVPTSEAGELFIGGDGLALGYWKDPALTAEKFVDLVGEKFYRTGDRVRRLPSGVIQFLGRRDNQVKIRGYRIELGEIEATLALQAGVLRCAVIALGDGADKTLAACYAGPAEPAALRHSLRSLLPDYMVPSHFTPIDSLPLTANGKIDRARLPEPAATPPPLDEAEPRSDLEQTMCGIWSQVLPHPAPGLNDNFFDIGGTSLKLVEAHSRLVRALHRQIPVTSLFEYPTIASLAAFLDPDSAKNSAGASRLAIAAGRARMQRDALARKQLSKKVP